MDQLMVEVPRGLQVGAGDEAVLIGRQGSETISIEQQASLVSTIDYEIACGYGARLERAYQSSTSATTSRQ
jgi:alanine racemase